MADERLQKPADKPVSSIETEEVLENRTDDDSKMPTRLDRKRFRGRDSPKIDPATCQMLNQTMVEVSKCAIYEVKKSQ